MNTKNCASDLATYLGGNTVGGVALVLGRNTFAAPPSPMASACVFLTNDGGEVEPFIHPTASALFKAGVKLNVYGTAGTPGFTAGENLAREAMEFLHQKIPTGYVGVRSLDAAPQYLGPDATGRHRWEVSLSAWYVG